MKKRIVRLTESDISRMVRRVIIEGESKTVAPTKKMLTDNISLYSGTDRGVDYLVYALTMSYADNMVEPKNTLIPGVFEDFKKMIKKATKGVTGYAIHSGTVDAGASKPRATTSVPKDYPKLDHEWSKCTNCQIINATGRNGRSYKVVKNGNKWLTKLRADNIAKSFGGVKFNILTNRTDVKKYTRVTVKLTKIKKPDAKDKASFGVANPYKGNYIWDYRPSLANDNWKPITFQTYFDYLQKGGKVSGEAKSSNFMASIKEIFNKGIKGPLYGTDLWAALRNTSFKEFVTA